MDPLIAPELRTWARVAISQIGAKVRSAPQKRRRALIIHLDGVPRELLETYVETGQMPFLSSLVRSGAYSMDEAFWGSPSSTPCFQAGLLYGLRHPNMPGYLWFDRALGRVVRMNVPSDTALIESRMRPHEGNSLLAKDGTAYLSLFTAGASNQLAMSSLANKRSSMRAFAKTLEGLPQAARGDALSYLKYLVRGMGHTTAEVARWVRKLKDTRHERDFLVNRFLMGLAWDYAQRRVLVDMVRGVPVIYLVFGSYDEVSHRRGPRSLESSRELWRVDATLAELYAVARTLDASYDVYFVTDHGHVECDPFEQRQGSSLETYLTSGPVPPLREEVSRALLDGRTPLPSRPERRPLTVVDAGNFAHVYLDGGKQPLDARDLLARRPDLLSRAAHSPHVALSVVRRGEGAVALINGELFTAEELHRAPLSDEFSRHAVADLLRELPQMPNGGDLVLFGQSVGKGRTVAFAWEFGSHGGVTRIETDSTICWPKNAPVQLNGLTHSIQLHERLRGAYRDG